MKISMNLARHHKIEISSSGVWRITKRLDMNRLPASQRHNSHARRWKDYEKPLAGHQVQIDVKVIDPHKGSGKRYQRFTAIDDSTRPRILRIDEHLNQMTAIQFAVYVLEKLPFDVQSIQTDKWIRIPIGVPLAPSGSRDSARLHQAPHA